ncbi:hypothetical protein ALC56_00120 [Trachymyrmex septentrionalis]|uniref:Uncharacterized protein n=1 Tax=Trachymyrmex septentrionalis TaxID=34720 RepID=A0A195FYB9_9HYME|nr:hypothetical protein ALC56_00120 [Trachymyrmex septentrionalis]
MGRTTTKTRSDAHSIANVPSRGNIGTELPPPPPPLSAGSVRYACVVVYSDKKWLLHFKLNSCEIGVQVSEDVEIALRHVWTIDRLLQYFLLELCRGPEEESMQQKGVLRVGFYSREFYEQERYLLFDFTMEEESYCQP